MTDRSPPVADVEHDDPCWFFFTSGTTGRPKAAVLTHGQMAFVVTNHLADLMPATTHRDASLVVAPLSHGAGIHQLVQVARGAKTVLLGGERFDAADAWMLVERWRVSNMFTVPTILKMLTEHPAVDKHDHSSLRYVIYAGAPMYREDQKHALAKLGKVLVQYFGLGEVTGNITVLPPALHEPEDGPGVKARHLRLTSAPACRFPSRTMPAARSGPEKRAEICVCGPAVFAGYYDNPGCEREGVPRRLVPHRRSRLSRRAGLSLHHRPRVRHVHLGRFERLSARDRREGADASCRSRGRDPRRSRYDMGRGRRRRLRVAAQGAARRARTAGMARAESRTLQIAQAASFSGTNCRSPATARSPRNSFAPNWKRAAVCQSDEHGRCIGRTVTADVRSADNPGNRRRVRYRLCRC